MSESLFMTCGWPSLGLGPLIGLALGVAIWAMVRALRGHAARRRFAGAALAVAFVPLAAGLLAWQLKAPAAGIAGDPAQLAQLTLEARSCGEIGVAGSFFNVWLAAGALVLAFLIPVRK